MISVEAAQLAANLEMYLQKVARGEVIVVFVNDQAVAELRPADVATGVRRPIGLCAGEFVAPEDFDAPLPEEVIREFDGQ
jgi:antitoxin (DNA-binding transcriptional repressor) of toxin-antitoxin stability system